VPIVPIVAETETGSAEQPAATAAATEEDDENEEQDVLIPSESYDGLICAACVKSHPLLRDRAGTEGWMIIEPNQGGEGGFRVVGRREETTTTKQDEADGKRDERGVKGDEHGDKSGRTKELISGTSEEKTDKRLSADESLGKRSRSEEAEAAGSDAEVKRPKLESNGQVEATATATATVTAPWKWKGKGDVFLAYGVREALKNELDVSPIVSSRRSLLRTGYGGRG
jgi:E3 ubiquitin-protein ligase UBR7